MKNDIVSWNEMKLKQPELFEKFVLFVMQRYSEPRDVAIDSVDEHWILSIDKNGRFIGIEDLTNQAFFLKDLEDRLNRPTKQ